jgi:SAM-dependent methyltransferase
MVICPDCAAAVTLREDGYRCASCGVEYPITDGVATFIAARTDLEGFKGRFVDILLGDVDRRHFWFRARNDIILTLYRRYADLGGRFLEIGCGTGIVLDRLVTSGVAAEGLDALPAAVAACRARTGAPVWLADARHLPFAEEFDTIGIFDCLEHVQDHDAVVDSARRALRRGGRLLLTVPAGPHLWSDLDEAMGHVRRYAPDDLRTVLERNGFRVALLTHYNAVLLPLYWLQRKLLARRARPLDANLVEQAVRVPAAPLNEVLYWIMRSESWLISRCYVPWGASLAAVAVRD